MKLRVMRCIPGFQTPIEKAHQTSPRIDLNRQWRLLQGHGFTDKSKILERRLGGCMSRTDGSRPPCAVGCARHPLVGHSAGGLFMRVFAHDYPADVAAMVFIDPATEASYERMRQSSTSDWQTMETKLPKGLRRQWVGLPASLEEARSAWPLPSVPYVMITALKPLGEWGLKSREDMEAWAREHQAVLS